MSTRGQFNTKNPTIKRILKEASELAASPSPDYHAEPLDSNLFEWHFTIRGPSAPSPYAGGLYHGRIILPPSYPLRPPNFRFLTPTGRFEVNREICLSISGHHEETWQPAWGVRTALVAIRSFMDTDAKGQIGGIECSREARQRMARESNAWKCAACGKSNADVMRERLALVDDIEAREGKRKDEHVPDDLRLAYRDELAEKSNEGAPSAKGKQKAVDAPHAGAVPPAAPASAPVPPRTAQAPLVQPPAQRRPEPSLAMVDVFIYGVVAALLFMVLKRFA